MIYKGPSIVSKINEELINILENERVKNISDIVGSKN
jgi:Dihydroorotate dehydrogenase